MFLALEMSLICTAANIPLHVHAEGLRGTGKTTVMRWGKHIAPDIIQVKQCIYHCHPEWPHCPIHTNRNIQATVETENIPMPFIEIGHGAKLGTILGSVDLAKLTDSNNPKAALLPGSIPMANRGVIFIDEINRLAETAPEITDVLLSLMGTKPGKIKIEEVGLKPWEIQVYSSVWATSNPDERPGPLEEIRKQLSDRFDMVVPVLRPSDPIIIQRLLWNKHQNVSRTAQRTKTSVDIPQKAIKLDKVVVPQNIIKYMADLYIDNDIESFRAIESLDLTSRCLAAMHGKDKVSFDEIKVVLPLVLRHRVEPIVLSNILNDLESRTKTNERSYTNPINSDRFKFPSQPNVIDTPHISDQKTSQNNQNGSSARIIDNPSATKSEHKAQFKTVQEKSIPKNDVHWLLNWFQKLVSLYNSKRKSYCYKTSTPSSVKPSSNDLGEKKQANRQTTCELTTPVSPPEKARNIKHLSWEDMLVISEWKDRIE